VDHAIAQGLHGIAITDHNSGSWIKPIKAAAASTALVVFPGVEITCAGGTDGIHIIALFDPSCGEGHVEGLLSELGFRPEDYGNINAVVTKNPIEVVQTIVRRNAIPVLAHANSTRGALCDMRGQQRIQLVQCPSLKAVEATDCNDHDRRRRRRRLIDILDGSDPDYRRALSVHQGSDAHSLGAVGTRCSYFKLDQVNLEGLEQCFCDPQVRIRQDFEFQTLQYPQITGVKVKGGFLDDLEAQFHEGLNSVLGGKGAGKSLLVEFLRFALDQASEQEDVQTDHEAKLRSRLEEYSTVEVAARDEVGRPIMFKRTYDPADGNPYEGTPRDDVGQLFPVLFLSQNEIIRIAEDREQQIGFIDRFFDFRSYQAAIQNLEEQLRGTDSELSECFRARKESRLLETQVRQKQSDIQKLDTALKNPVFDEYTQLETKDRAVREQLDWLTGASQRLKGRRIDIEGTPVPAPPTHLAADPALRRINEWATQARSAVTARIEGALADLAEAADKANTEYLRWLPRFKEVKRQYEETIRTAGGDYKGLAQQRARIVKELDGLTSRLKAKQQVATRTKEVADKRKTLLQQITTAYQDYSAERRSRCEKISGDSGGKLQIVLHESSNREEFKRRLRELKKGSYLRDAEIDTICGAVPASEFMRAIINHAVSGNASHVEAVANKARMDAARMRALADFLAGNYEYENLLALEYTAMPQDSPEIKYDIGSGRYELLENLSVGQKCTAMLIMALTEGSRPIVIDQPEDSLDVRSIWEDICTKVRTGKERRQFIFTTHNSSVAVASDTDKFIIMEANADRGRVVYSGSMDHKPISEEALRYLEGGVQTYRTKFSKYRGDQII